MENCQNEELDLVFVLDESGSMQGVESDTIGGYNGMLDKQRSSSNNVKVTTIVFNDCAKIVHDRADVSTIANLTSKNYQPGGCTALLDAIGLGLKHISDIHKNMPANLTRPKVMFVVITDGLENASQKYSIEKIRKKIKKKQEKDGWEFVFLGANIDAIAEASKIGIGHNRVANFAATSMGVIGTFDCLSECIVSFASGKSHDMEKSLAELDKQMQTVKK